MGTQVAKILADSLPDVQRMILKDVLAGKVFSMTNVNIEELEKYRFIDVRSGKKCLHIELTKIGHLVALEARDFGNS